MSQRLHICRICGKKFATPKGLCGHQRIHSGSQRIWGFKESRVCSVSVSFMTEIEKHEVIKAAMNLVMLSQGVYDFADFMDLEFFQSGLEKLSTCSDVIAQALASYLRSKLKKKSQSRRKSRYKCKICGKSFVSSKVLGGHQTLHRSIKGRLERKMEYIDDDDSLYDSSEAKKIVSQSASFGVSQEEKMLLSVKPKLDFSKRLSHLGFNKSSSCSKTRFGALHSPTDAKKIVSEPPSFEVSQEEKILHFVESDKCSSFSKTRFSPLPSPPEAEKVVPEPPSFEISEDEKMLHSVEPKLDCTKLLSHSGFDKSSSGSKTRFGALPSPPEAKKNASQITTIKL
ncbi:hypothetical protein V5N11_010391 [Cardamine amara subsp. amara]|uniref:C2H2-type domain-containing protein n=1 Tax=Cardamine amara subsp. amara TaxID=228776 RepID=A0ABD0ZJ19_CARAN